MLHTPTIHVARDATHLAWDPAIPPVATVSSGDIVGFDCLDASNGQLTADSVTADLETLVFDQVDQVNGPVEVSGAEPGDALQIDILELTPANWGWTANIPGFGLLADDFPAPFYKVTAVPGASGRAEYWPGIHVPLAPFCGEMGVAPLTGPLSTIPPDVHGGNMDTRHLVAGSTLFLPVFVPGARFSIGDGHATQGDGEVCGTAIETPMRATVRLTVRKDVHVSGPEFLAAARPERRAALRPALRHRRDRTRPAHGRSGRAPPDDRLARSRTRAVRGRGIPAVQRRCGPADQRDRRRPELRRDRALPARHVRLGGARELGLRRRRRLAGRAPVGRPRISVPCWALAITVPQRRHGRPLRP